MQRFMSFCPALNDRLSSADSVQREYSFLALNQLTKRMCALVPGYSGFYLAELCDEIARCFSNEHLRG